MSKEIIEYIANSNFKIFAVTGNAGAGKTFFSDTACSEISEISKYSIDWRFIGNSKDRVELLRKKSEFSLPAYVDAINQFSWWNWDQVYKDIEFWIESGHISIKNHYDRVTGQIDETEQIYTSEKLLIEGAILGPPILLQSFDKIFFIHVPPEIRFQRLIEKDKGRRSIKDICIRFLITEYSENLHYQTLFKWYEDKIIFLNESWEIIPFIDTDKLIERNNYIPIRIEI